MHVLIAFQLGPRLHGGAAVWTTRRRGHVDRAVDLGRSRSKPSRVTHGGSALLGFGLRFVGFGRNLFLRPRGLELLLPFGLQFPFQLLDPLLLFRNDTILRGVLLPQVVELPVEGTGPLHVPIGRQDNAAQGRPAQMGTMTNVRASVLVIGVK